MNYFDAILEDSLMKALQLAIAPVLVLFLLQPQTAAADQGLIAIGVTPGVSTDPGQPSSDCARASRETERQLCVQEENLARLVQLQINSGAVMAASGAKYGRTGIEFWEHHGSATVDFYGIKLECTPVP